jgi:large subunit ribosomal protein L4e
MSAVPLVSVFSADDSNVVLEKKVALPAVFTAPIRNDIVQFVHTNISKNTRQAHGVDPRAGHKHAAESWGTGRAVARIPRISGSGTHRSGQAAFGNQCRKGRMSFPLHTWRRWHRKVNLKQKRHAVAASLAASAVTPLVQARGHRIQEVPELPLVIDDKLETYEKTKQAVEFLRRFGSYADVEKVISSKKLRAGKGKLRNRRYRIRKGPLVIYSSENAKLVKAFRNLPGVETCNVNRLNLKQLAPGGQLGRFCIWTNSAFKALDNIFGSYRKTGVQKAGYQLNRPVLSNADLARIINSNEVQSVVRAARTNTVNHEVQKKNPLTNKKAMDKLNPNAKVVRQVARQANEEARKRKAANAAKKVGVTKSLTKDEKTALKQRKRNSKAWIKNVTQQLDERARLDKEEEKAVHEQMKLDQGEEN